MGKTMVFDTETSGLPIMKSFNNYHPPNHFEYYKNARLIEIAYIIYDENNNIIKKTNNLVKPCGYTINNSNIHGITHEMAMKDGKDIKYVINEMNDDLKDIDKIVAHNIKFDINILISECFGVCNTEIISKLINITKECTMKTGKQIMKNKKNPKLVELYEYLFNDKFNQEHRALSDAECCALCYFEMNRIRNI